ISPSRYYAILEIQTIPYRKRSSKISVREALSGSPEGFIPAFFFIIQNIIQFETYFRVLFLSKSFRYIKVQTIERLGIYIRVLSKAYDLQSFTSYIIENSCFQT